MPVDKSTDVFCVRLSKLQAAKLSDFIGNQRPSEYLRQLIEADFVRHNLEWPDYEFIDNEKRRKRD